MNNEHLIWEKHIHLIENKVSKNVSVLYKTNKLINFKCLRSIYFWFIHPYINYANIAWASINKTKLKKLFGKQKQVARIEFNQDRFRHALPLLKTLNTLNVYQITLLQVLLFVDKIRSVHTQDKSQRERVIMPNIAFMHHVWLLGTAF